MDVFVRLLDKLDSATSRETQAMGSMDGKVAIVTGAARGIGKGMATALVKAGAAVTITDINKDTLEAARNELQKIPGAKLLALLADGTKDNEVKDAVRKTVEKFGPVSILINNAQAAAPKIPLEDQVVADIAIAMDTGFYASFRYMAACFPYLKDTQGTVINFGSDAGIVCNAKQLGYNAAKEAIRALTRTAAREWATHNVTVNAIIPGMLTEGLLQFAKEHPEHMERSKKSIPLGRLGDPETDAGSLVIYLASAGAKYLTGQTFNLNGGLNMRP
jgi:NAD(P)-dependent dehydrogenase (short-subunit alcohol dehydrogenase family)